MITWLRSHPLALVLVLAAAVRLAVLLAFPSIFGFEQTGAVHGSDAYDAYAQNLLATGVYGREAGVPDAAIPPLYSYALAGVYALLGRGALAVGAFHIALDLISITCLYHIGRRLFANGAAVGLLAGVFYAVYPYLVFQNLTLIDTPFFMALLHGFILAVVALRDAPAEARRRIAGLALLAGALLGLATLTRPILPPLALAVGLWFLFRLRPVQTLIRLLPVAVVAALMLVPWIARNQAVYGEFVAMSLTAGTNFYQGNNPLVVPYMRAGYDVQWIGPETQQHDPYSPAGDRERMALALDYLRAHPEAVPELLWVKLLAHWSIDVFPRRNPVEGEVPPLDYQGAVEAQTGAGGLELGGVPPGDPVAAYDDGAFAAGRVVHRFYFGALLALALAGIAATLRRWREVSLLWFVQLSMTLVYVIFHSSTRYRVPTDPLLFLFSSYAALEFIKVVMYHGFQSRLLPRKKME